MAVEGNVEEILDTNHEGHLISNQSLVFSRQVGLGLVWRKRIPQSWFANKNVTFEKNHPFQLLQADCLEEITVELNRHQIGIQIGDILRRATLVHQHSLHAFDIFLLD